MKIYHLSFSVQEQNLIQILRHRVTTKKRYGLLLTQQRMSTSRISLSTFQSHSASTYLPLPTISPALYAAVFGHGKKKTKQD